jgi:hypothetical protein
MFNSETSQLPSASPFLQFGKYFLADIIRLIMSDGHGTGLVTDLDRFVCITGDQPLLSYKCDAFVPALSLLVPIISPQLNALLVL